MSELVVSLKGKFPFRVGCTSYVYPRDILYNVRKMAGIVDDIEIILFESDDVCNFPDKPVIEELCEIANEYNLTYTIHFPTDKDAGSSDKRERQAFVGQIEKIMAITENLHPYSYILHLQGIINRAEKYAVSVWKDNCYEVCEKVKMIPYVRAEEICVENLFYPPEWHMDIIKEFGFSFCMDIGHFWVDNIENWENFTRDNLKRTRVIHLHGVCDGRDHISLNNSRIEDVAKAFNILKGGYNHVVTLEIFDRENLFQSMRLIDELWFEK